MKCNLSVPTKFSKIQLKNFFHAKIENQSFRLMGCSYLRFNFWCEKAAKVFCEMSQKVYPERPFEFRLSICQNWAYFGTERHKALLSRIFLESMPILQKILSRTKTMSYEVFKILLQHVSTFVTRIVV